MSAAQDRQRLSTALNAAGKYVEAFEVGDVDMTPFRSDLIDAVHDLQALGILDDNGELIEAVDVIPSMKVGD